MIERRSVQRTQRWPRVLRRLCLGTLCVALAATAAPGQAPEFRRAEQPRTWSFPRDHGAHPGFATEWWYFTGSLFDTEGFHFGFELTFFRVGLRPDAVPSSSPWRARDLVLAHFAVTEVTWERFHAFERIQRAAAGMAGADSTRLNVWIGDWSAEQRQDGSIHIRAHEGTMGIDLELISTRPVVLHGENGLSWKTHERNGPNAQASYYASLTRLQTTGTIVVGDHPRRVSGMAWMDQEFFTGDTPREGLGWDWFSARLADGRDLVLYRVRREGEADSVFGTLVASDGSSRLVDTTHARFVPGTTWTSPGTGAVYPIEWEIELPAERSEISVRALLPEQEVHAHETVGFAYWEGISRFSGSWGGARVEGEGYVELTGYAPDATKRP